MCAIRSGTLVNKLFRDCAGASLVEFTLVFPVLILVALGTVDVAFMLSEWVQANKAVYRGARVAIVRDPVAPAVTSPAFDPARIGQLCFDPATGTTTGACSSFNYLCEIPVNAANCPSFDNTAFNSIVAEMQQIYSRIQTGHVQIRYQTTGLGFAGRPGGLPMTVTVNLKCMTHRYYFINSLMQWIFTAPQAPCPAGQPAGPPLPGFASTLPSEDVETN
jgi:hypothetical protein